MVPPEFLLIKFFSILAIIDLFPGTNLQSSQIAIMILIPKLANAEKDDPDIVSLKMAKYVS